jgi:AcrR family transcriptional regulator
MGSTTRDKLLAAAQRCLARHGFVATTEEMIVAESGEDTRAIAESFGSLDGLLLNALSTHFRRWLEPLMHAFTEVGRDPQARLRRGFELFLSELPERNALTAAWLEAVAVSARDDTLRQRIATNQAGFRAALATTLREAGAARPDEVSDSLMIAFDGLLVGYLLHHEVPGFEQLAADLHDAFATP